ncbi:iduronate 2-sulfatase [Jejuia pallidilutea]|uniref:Iduronate 2-sulfatase n=1 Tax=Jejuia pallidilutea TaxID=504487 RepID=A0A362X1L2_9FLAO|nr:sulfatase [Jejuia pallidilutea]PQV49010.1 iduronate 2-sulfatase [Jejuia pallidilutea]
MMNKACSNKENIQSNPILFIKTSLFLLLIVLTMSCKENEITKSPKNILLICVDDLRPELNTFGATYIKSPHIDELASKGRAFHNHFVNAPSCGPSRYTLLTGQYGLQYRQNGNRALFFRAKNKTSNSGSVPPSMPEWFKQHGYTTVSVGKVSHHPGGRGGENWNDNTIPEMPDAWDEHIMPVGAWKTPRGSMHGLAHGRIRTDTDRAVIETVDDGDNSYPDGLIAEEGLKQLETLANADKPFFLAIGLIKPHLPFGVPKTYLDMYEGVEIPPIPHPEKPEGKTTWHASKEFMNYHRGGRNPNEDVDFAMELKKYYAACVSYADKHVGDILSKLKETGADKNTIVVLWGDHGWHLGEHAIWGKHALFDESLHSPLIIYAPEMEQNGKKSDAFVETIDVFPTLCELSELPVPNFAHGVSLKPILDNPEAEGHSVAGYYTNASTLRTPNYRFIQHKIGDVELYNHNSTEKETKNIANENQELVNTLKHQLEEKLGPLAFSWDVKQNKK